MNGVHIVSSLLLILIGISSIPVLTLAVQTTAACLDPAVRQCGDPVAGKVQQRPSVAVLIPAHNEANGIAATLASIRQQLRPGDRLLVIADNCTDQTAALATAAGAKVTVRHDQSKRGKGYALDHGLRYLSADLPEVVIVIDADCTISDGGIDLLALRAHSAMRPVQALDLLRSPDNSGIAVRLAEFAFLFRNLVRPLGMHRLGQPCHLMGTGMAIPRELLAAVDFASGELAEDMVMGINLACIGKPVMFYPDVQVTSWFARDIGALRQQKTRWEHGHLGVMVQEGPKLLQTWWRSGDARLLALAFETAVPPLALLALVQLLLWLLTLGLYVLVGAALPLVLAGASLALLCFTVLLAWWRFGRRTVSLTDLLYVGWYLMWKVPVYAKFLLNRQVEWVRSQRDGH